MRLYKECQKELYGFIVEEFDHGFVSFKPVTKDKGLYIQLLYIDRHYRKQGNARKMILDICDKYGAEYITGFIDLNTNNYRHTLIAHLEAGYDIVDANKDSLIVSITKENLKNG